MTRKEMLAEERRQDILRMMEDEHVTKTSELAKHYSVSSATIRNDLRTLADHGHLQRVHGGAITQRWLSREASYREKAQLHAREKQAIGRLAASMIEEGTAVFIGNGTTTMEIIRNLPSDRHLRIFTNALNHAEELASRSNVEAFVVGGFLRGVSLAMVGHIAKRALEGVYFDLAFLGVNGASVEYGLTIPSLEESAIATEISRRSQRTVIVADHSKFGVLTHGKIADLSDISMLITDKLPDSGTREALARWGVEVCLTNGRGGEH